MSPNFPEDTFFHKGDCEHACCCKKDVESINLKKKTNFHGETIKVH